MLSNYTLIAKLPARKPSSGPNRTVFTLRGVGFILVLARLTLGTEFIFISRESPKGTVGASVRFDGSIRAGLAHLAFVCGAF